MKSSGIGPKSRERLAKVLRSTQGTISVAEAAEILSIAPPQATKLLSFWAKQGWLKRIKNGLYIPIPITTNPGQAVVEDPWLIAHKIFDPCYIGGWTAAREWGLTEQIFNTIMVITSKKVKDRTPTISDLKFKIHVTNAKFMFGTKTQWHGQVKIGISDPSKTILDMLKTPAIGGGIRHIIEMLQSYMKSEHKNISKLTEYLEKLNIGAVYKRLGFLLQTYCPDEVSLISICEAKKTKGKSKLDPALEENELVTSWNLWVPSSIKSATNDT